MKETTADRIIGTILLLLAICAAVLAASDLQTPSTHTLKIECEMEAIRDYADNDVIGSFNNLSNIDYLTEHSYINCEYSNYQRQGVELINNSTIHYSISNGSGEVTLGFDFGVHGGQGVIHNPVVYLRNDLKKPCDGGEVVSISAYLMEDNCFGPACYHRPDEIRYLFAKICIDGVSNYTSCDCCKTCPMFPPGGLPFGSYTIYRVYFTFNHKECDTNDSFYIGIDDLGGYRGVDGNGNHGADNKEIKICFVP